MKHWKRLLLLSLCLLLMLLPAAAEETEEIEESVILTDSGEEIPDQPTQPEETAALTEPVEEPVINPAREDFIQRIIDLGEQLYIKANGKAQRAHYSGDIYVCKNFTVYLFRQNRDDFRMAEFPDTPLVIPNNLKKEKCKPYYYGFYWEDVPASKGNPFYAAAQFKYDTGLSKEENMENALAFMRQVKKGDYFQMSAKYQYGTGAHSAIMISDYDPETDSVHWMDSNMRGGSKNGIRYGIVQFDEVKDITWWAEAFCLKGRGATLYRLRDDIVYAQ